MKRVVAGVDEVGRGSLIGPVFAAAVIFKKKVDKKTNVVSFEKNKISEPKIFEEKKFEEPLVLTEEPLVLNETVKKNNNDINLSPAVRKIVEEKKIDVSKIHGTGKDGRILKGDIINLMATKPLPNQKKLEKGEEERFKMTRLRQTIAKRLKEAQNSAAMLTTFNEVDMSEIISMRNQYKDEFQNSYGVKLGLSLIHISEPTRRRLI